jgi:hypothetical protein
VPSFLTVLKRVYTYHYNAMAALVTAGVLMKWVKRSWKLDEDLEKTGQTVFVKVGFLKILLLFTGNNCLVFILPSHFYNALIL